ncbi:hypothetical protein ACIBM3_29065 [Rhodococcus erythropolis]|uniref:hypothetical protein n=1 Tax=Rhodococcus erythropolis TaxID=1833 RepID=UPI0037AA1AC9
MTTRFAEVPRLVASGVRAGKFFDGTTIPGGTGGATCIITGSETIFILEYDSNFERQNDLVAYHMGFYASSIDESGRIMCSATNTVAEHWAWHRKGVTALRLTRQKSANNARSLGRSVRGAGELRKHLFS